MKRNRTSASFMTRLGRDQRGNTIAIVAAAIVPLLGMIGGGIDMSRLYLAKTRLQQACDAGALAGRRAMGSGSWDVSTPNQPVDRANELFQANFASGAYGTTLVGREFTQEDGTVNGTATVAVPMTVMRIFGMQTRNLTVTCTAKMEIPNTDVMFVLDVTGSMNCRPGDGSCSNNNNTPATGAKITGLKSAVKCFYEALTRVNTSEVCGNDPTATTYTGTAQIRMGFVPYSVNVNVGRLLNNEWLADTWSYQSREAITETAYGWTAGTESAITDWSNWSSVPSNRDATSLQNANTYPTSGTGSWTTTSGDVPVGGVDRPQYRTASDSASCTSPNFPNSSASVIGYTDISNVQTQLVSDPAPEHPATSQQRGYTQSDDHTVTAYKYTWYDNGNASRKCRLQAAQVTYTLNRTNGRSTRLISWTTYPGRFVNWVYRQKEWTVSSLKTGGVTWANSVSLPLATSTGATVKLSGSNNNTTLSFVANTPVTWDGCIEERQTVQNSDGDPTDEWTSIPADAYDLSIDMIPRSDIPGSYWGPMLQGAVWGRYLGNSNTTNDVTTAINLSRNMEYYCSTEAKKLQPWGTPAPFETYVNSLRAIGNTYHDIGMIWGARFISPTGLFSSENAETPTGGAIQRHIIFMTDGDTMTSNTNYSAHGIHWWDKRQTTYTPNSTQLNNILNARLSALCEAIKARNITLWVVSYGGGIDTNTETRLEACATGGKYFSATDTPTLISNFKQIASEIADLRLTS